MLVEPLGLEYIAGAVSDMADVRIHDMRVDPTPLSDVMRSFDPGVVGLRQNYMVDADSVKQVAHEVKQIAPDVPVIVGGHHVSLCPEDAFSDDVDAIVIGEGEWTFRRLLKQLQSTCRLDTADVIHRTRNGDYDRSNIKAVPKSAFKQFDSPEMNQRPEPARHLVDHYRPDYYFLYHEQPYSIEMARGCIYRCNFCSVHEFFNGTYRVQGNERTLAELASLPQNSWVNVVDDLAVQEMSGAQRLHNSGEQDPMEQLANQVIEMKMGHRYWMQVRADNVVRNPRKFEKWAEAGLDTALIGLESFDQADLNSVSKGTKSNDNEKAIEILHSFGVRIWGAVIVFQDWSEANFENLKNKVHEYNIEFPQFTILTPLPGTGQWATTEHKLLTKAHQFFDFLHSVLPTRLSPQRFYEEYAALWRTVGGGGVGRAKKMLQEVSTTRRSVARFLGQYGALSALPTYRTGIQLLEKGLSSSSRPRERSTV